MSRGLATNVRSFLLLNSWLLGCLQQYPFELNSAQVIFCHELRRIGKPAVGPTEPCGEGLPWQPVRPSSASLDPLPSSIPAGPTRAPVPVRAHGTALK